MSKDPESHPGAEDTQHGATHQPGRGAAEHTGHQASRQGEPAEPPEPIDPAGQLLGLYWEQFAEEQVSLEDFCRRAAAGELGPYSRDDLRLFLEAVESNILSNIQTMVEVNPELEPLREERVAETQDMIAGLIARYATTPDRKR